MGGGLGIMMAGERKGIWNTCRPLPGKGQYMQEMAPAAAGNHHIGISISSSPAAAAAGSC